MKTFQEVLISLLNGSFLEWLILEHIKGKASKKMKK